ncbi:hypothetical protein EB796_000598 [Bugula neritina]|uniref:Uncharacterized protein n=1 Tax=Bugula neritina TaxID=10212 RepID=A0A7J7KSG9_BUGNE|nr:hypothetical protein EB796_000598 [Bugula neritina]
MGRGSYGRLGLGTPPITTSSESSFGSESENIKIRMISSSKGSDGHTLAVTQDGELYSWGDGDFGKLGHGNSLFRKYRKEFWVI